MKIFENLSFKQVKTLLEVLNDSRDSHLDVIKRRYQSLSENYIGSSEFLAAVKIIEEKNSKIIIKDSFKRSWEGRLGEKNLKSLLLREMLTANSEIKSDICNYLEQFKKEGESYGYKPPTKVRIKESPLRNFLMEMDLVEYDKESGIYKISFQYYDLFQEFLKKNFLTVADFEVARKNKEELGKIAELEVLEYEKLRLDKYPALVKNIRHIAQSYVNAGFDILSWEKEMQDGEHVKRYIEVKAVSLESYNFFWSRNEVEKAKLLASQYYLYLLPVTNEKKFDVSKLEIICNPIINVFDNSKSWKKEIENYSFTKNN